MKLSGFQNPKSKNNRKQNHFDLTGLNSYKVDTLILTDKAKSLQRLKNKLQSQIFNFENTQSQYKSELEALQQELRLLKDQNIHLKDQNLHLKDQNIKLKDRIRKLQLRNSMTANDLKNKKLDNKNEQLEHLSKKIFDLQKELAQKDIAISEREEYKKMYQIEVQNKHNLMNFYEAKLLSIKLDNKKLIHTYEAKISILQSGFNVNNTQYNQLPQIESKNNITKAKTHKIIDDRSKRQSAPIQSMTSLQINQNSRVSKIYKLNLQSKADENFSPYRTKNQNNQIRQSEERLIHNKTQLHFLMRQIFVNLKRKGIQSENLRNFKNIQIFVNIQNPSIQIVRKILNESPLGSINMSDEHINEAIKELQQKLSTQYAYISGNLVIQFIIDKIEDFEIANQFNAEDQSFIIAGLNKIH